ncbi:MAG: TusE/DsrC/DsvC family sulfur relay protein [Gammaproteobacteria bacterium]|nr:TusE/DsrC/DsvC family sulfur relay protein [Gammaproteobacteria bacterium]
MSLEHAGKIIDVDNEGYLLEPELWNEELALKIADGMSLEMNEDRWQIVRIVREHYEHTTCVMELRKVLKALKEQSGADKATRKHVYQLFPYGYGQQACKIAGMRKPLKVLLDL